LKCERTNCEISESERRTAKRLNMHPEDVHHMMDVHMEMIEEVLKEQIAASKARRSARVQEALDKK
jgi:heme oxygenase